MPKVKTKIKKYKRIHWGKEKHWPKPTAGETCHDCGVLPGKLHVSDVGFICDVEECPICYRQLLSCGHAKDIFPGYPKRRSPVSQMSLKEFTDWVYNKTKGG